MSAPEAQKLDKRIATIAAELALAGFALHRMTCGAYLITRWNLSTYAPNLRAAQAFLDRVKGHV